MSREHTIQLIRARRAMMATLPRRRARVPRQQQPDGIRLLYAKALYGYLATARGMLEARVYPRARRLVEQRAARADAADDLNSLVDQASEEFFRSVMRPPDIEELARTVAARTSSYQREELGAQLRAVVGVDVLGAEPDLSPRVSEFVAENVALIKSVPNAMFDDIEKTITRALREGTRWEVLAAQLEQRHGVAESSATLIARDQVGKFFGEMNRVRQGALGITHFIWRTVHDARVREEHAALDGQRFAWDAPPGEGIPGEPINCRCGAEPDLSPLLE